MAPSNILPYALDNTDNAIVKELDYLLGRMKALSVQYVDESMRDETDLLEHRSPEELKRLLDLSLPQAGVGAEGIFKTVEETFKYSVRSWNPRFMEKLYAGTNPVGVLSELLIAVMNANCHVYQVSPVFTLMEVDITEAMSKMLGFKAGSGGLVCPGGSASNQLAMITARNVLFPHIKTEGPLRGEILTVFTSAHSHYSIDKSAMALGIGSKHVIKVPCTREGKMIPEELERLILESKSRGEVPFFVNATAGTTVLAAFDPIREIANIGHRHNCWVHVDGSWGGSVIFSKNHRALMDGSELVDTVTINPHKLLGTPLQCSALLARRGLGVFKEANSLNAGYLFHGNSVDLGDGTIGCGRRPDAVKMFMAWKYYGADGFNARLERAFNNVQHMATSIKTHPRFQLVVQPESVNVCFWYIPASIPANLATTDPEAYRMTISHVTRVLNQRLTASGRFLVDYAPCNHPVVLPLFFRLPINPPTITPRILDELLDTLAALGEVEEVTVAAKGGWVKCAKEVDIHRKMELSKAANLVESRST